MIPDALFEAWIKKYPIKTPKVAQKIILEGYEKAFEKTFESFLCRRILYSTSTYGRIFRKRFRIDMQLS